MCRKMGWILISLLLAGCVSTETAVPPTLSVAEQPAPTLAPHPIEPTAFQTRYPTPTFTKIAPPQTILPLPTLPLQTPPAPLAAPTTLPPVPISQGFAAAVQRLADPSGTAILRAFAFPDEQHGWLALGSQILATTDGGKTWKGQTNTSSQVTAITFLDSQVGWVKMVEGYLVTRNGGQNWQAASVPPMDPRSRLAPPPISPGPDDHDPHGMYAFCDRNSTAVYAGEFFSIDPQTGWALCLGPAAAHFSGTELFQTQDGGQHWQLISDPPHGPFNEPTLFFLDAQHGWIACDDSIFATQDGGKTWQQLPPVTINSGQMTLYKPAGIHFLSVQVGFAIFHQTDRMENQDQDTLVKTLDGGITWQLVYSAPVRIPITVGPFQMFPDGRGIGIAGYCLAVTTDAGQTWSAGEVMSDQNCPVDGDNPDISFPDPLHGWITFLPGVPSLKFLSTADGGKTWQEHAVTGSRMGNSFVGVSFPNPQTGYLVTQAGYLYRTDDAGSSFELVDSESVHTLSLHFVTPEVGWEIRGTQLFQSADGGKSWQAIPFPMPVQFFSLLPDGRAWIIAGERTSEDGNPVNLHLFSTENGGRTWAEHAFEGLQPNEGSPWLDAIQFADAQHGWLRANGAFFYTMDGGYQWVQLH